MNFGFYDHPFLMALMFLVIFAGLSSCSFKKKEVEIKESVKDRPTVTFDIEKREVYLNEYKEKN
jgi:hypothetical protein